MSVHNTLPLVAAAVSKMELGHNNRRYENMITRSREMILKCVNKVTSEKELSAPHVAYFLLGHDDKYCSHQYKCLNMFSFLSQIQEYEDDIDGIQQQFRIETGNDGVIMLDETCDYLYRGPKLKSLSLYEYTCNIEKVTRKSQETLKSAQPGTMKTGRPLNDRFSFDEKHPQSQTHLQRLRTKPVVPRLTFFPPSPYSNKELHAKCMLLLFKPYDSFRDLLPVDTWESSYSSFQFGKEHREHLANIQEMHMGLTRKREMDQERNKIDNSESAEGCEDDVFSFQQSFDSYHLSDEEVEDISYDDCTFDVNAPQDSIMRDIDILSRTTNLSEHLDKHQNACRNNGDEHRFLPVSKVNIMEWKAAMEFERTAKQNELRGNVEDFNLYNKMFDMPVDMKPFTSNRYGAQILQSVIDKFTLNSLQEKSFRVMAQNVMDRLNGVSVQQKLSYLGGSGGTGKSTVIVALKHFFEEIGMKYALRLSAFTGIAAGGIGGSTLCSISGISSRSTSQRTDRKKLEQDWEHVTTLVIDEVSMLSCEMLAKLHENLVKAKNTPSTVPFGGIDILFVGHWFMMFTSNMYT